MPRNRRPSELLPPEWYDAQLACQDGGCAICRRPPRKRRLHIDHDHATGRVRGLLCYRCNRLLVLAGVTADVLRSAARYVESGGVVRDSVTL